MIRHSVFLFMIVRVRKWNRRPASHKWRWQLNTNSFTQNLIIVYYLFRMPPRKISWRDIRISHNTPQYVPRYYALVYVKYTHANVAISSQNRMKPLFSHRFDRSQNKKILWNWLGNCCKFRKFLKWPQTSPNVPIRWEIQKTSSSPNFQILEICYIFAKIAKCINLSRNTKKIRAWRICKF